MPDKPKRRGQFVISLDFELYWGMFDKVTLRDYGANIRGVHSVLPRLLDIFSEYGIHATWATVGMLMYKDKQSLRESLPPKELRPNYKNKNLSTYDYLAKAKLGENESTDPYHFGASLIQKIKATPNQEIGSHTFSHYYCLEEQAYQSGEAALTADCAAMQKVANQFGVTPTAIVFPRNQTSAEALRIVKEYGIKCYRGTENSFIYHPRKDEEQSLFIRALRLLDNYVNLTGQHTYDLTFTNDYSGTLINVPSSRFLRPWNRRLNWLEPLRLLRIKRAMSYAAKNGCLFHLWWHPHNFGVNQEQNLAFLRKILDHYLFLQEKYGMESATMTEAALFAKD